MTLNYKVWVELEMPSPLGWNIDILLPVTSTFGVLLNHSPLSNATAHKLTAIMAVPRGMQMDRFN
jgi:hypothetical protein